MGFLSNLFGGGPKTTVVQSKIPEELAPYVKEVLGETQKLYAQRMGETPDQYQYAGQTIADLTPDQIKARGGIRGLVGGTDEDYRLAREGIIGGDERFETGIDPRRLDTPAPIDATIERRAVDFGGAPTEFTSERFQPKEMSEYMSPYAAAVTEIEKREAEEDFAKLMPTFEKQAAAMGGMSGMGSRAGVQAGILGSKHLENINKIQKRGLQEAYVDAQRRKAEDFKRFQDQRGFEERERGFLKGERDILTSLDIRDIENRRRERQFGVDFAKGERDFEKGERTFEAAQFANRKAREKAQAADLQRLATGQYSQKMRELGGLETIGATEEARSQKGLDRAYADWLERRERPETQLARYTSSIYGNPMLRSPSKTTTTPGIGLGQQMLGFGMAAMGMPQFGTAMAFGGRPQAATAEGGGGIASLMDNVVYRQTPGQVGEGETSRRAAPSWRSHHNMGSPEFKNLLSNLSTPKPFSGTLKIPTDRGMLEVDRETTQNNLRAMKENKNDPRYKPHYDQLQKRLIEIDRRLEKLKQVPSEAPVPPPTGDGSSTGSSAADNAPVVSGVSGMDPRNRKKPKQDSSKKPIQPVITSDSDAAKLDAAEAAAGNVTVDPKSLLPLDYLLLKERVKNQKSLMDLAEGVLGDLTSKNIKDSYNLTTKQMDAANTTIKNLHTDAKAALEAVYQKYGKRANTPHPLFYMGIQAATNPDGLFAGMSEGLLQWSKVSRLDDREFNEVQRALGKSLYDHGMAEIQHESGVLNAKNKLSAEMRAQIKALPAQKLAIINMMFQSGASVDKIRIELMRLRAKSDKRYGFTQGFTQKELQTQLLGNPQIRKIFGTDKGSTEELATKYTGKHMDTFVAVENYIRRKARALAQKKANRLGRNLLQGQVQEIEDGVMRELFKEIGGLGRNSKDKLMKILDRLNKEIE